jgi:hypothetical protein
MAFFWLSPDELFTTEDFVSMLPLSSSTSVSLVFLVFELLYSKGKETALEVIGIKGLAHSISSFPVIGLLIIDAMPMKSDRVDSFNLSLSSVRWNPLCTMKYTFHKSTII